MGTTTEPPTTQQYQQSSTRITRRWDASSLILLLLHSVQFIRGRLSNFGQQLAVLPLSQYELSQFQHKSRGRVIQRTLRCPILRGTERLRLSPARRINERLLVPGCALPCIVQRNGEKAQLRVFLLSGIAIATCAFDGGE